VPIAKILFTGTTGAGKTTAIRALSDTPAVVTDVRNTDPAIPKDLTTVGLDYGQITLAGGEVVRLYGTPGQARFDFLWRILARQALGVVILVDNTQPAPLDQLAVYLAGLRATLSTTPCTVGVGRTDVQPWPDIDRYADFLAEQHWVMPVLAVDVRRRADVLLLVETVLAQVEAEGDVA
jgi:signal recognition particle receptor subunit beta